MNPAILISAVGLVFVAVGAWLYRNPRNLIPAWGILNRENPGVQRLARIYGRFFIFCGVFTVCALIVPLLFPKSLTFVLSLTLAILGTWLLPRRLRKASAEVVTAAGADASLGTQVPATQEQKVLSKHWKRNLAIVAALGAILTVFVVVLIADSDVSKFAFATAQASPIVRRRLGEPVHRGFFMSGTIETSGPSGQADIAIPISGPTGKATLYAVARKSAGLWKFDTLDIAVDGESNRTSLLNPTTESAQPSTAAPSEPHKD